MPARATSGAAAHGAHRGRSRLVCEILSSGTRSYDLLVKRSFYAGIGVRHLWYIDPEARTVAVSRLEGGRWLELGIHGGEQIVRAEPFEAIELSRGPWWEGIAE